MTIHELEEKIRRADKAYWEDGAPEMADAEYDALVEELRRLSPDHPLVNRINAPSAAGGKITHEKPMLSLGKVYSREELKAWAARVARDPQERFCLQPKYDGISGRLLHGVLATRGDGKVGVNITDKLAIMEIESDKSDGILGEIVIRDSDFREKYSRVVRENGECFKNSRNAVAGIVGRDDVSFYKKQGAKLTFVDYDRHSVSFALKDWDDVFEGLYSRLVALDYPMDGLVLRLADEAYAESLGSTDHHPKGAMALKFANESVESVVTGFTKTIGKRGTLSVTVQIEPRDIGGVTVTNVKVPVFRTNDGQPGVADGGIRIGSRVKVERAGNVIPYLAEVIETGEGVVCDTAVCPVCGKTLVRDGANLYCTNADCMEQIVNRLYFSVATLGMFGIGKEIVRSVVEQCGVRDLLGWMKLNADGLKGLDGFGDTKTANVMAEIEKARRCTRQQFLTALNIPELGHKVSELLLASYPFEEILTITQGQLLAVEGVGEKMAKAILEGLHENSGYIKSLLEEFDFKGETPKPSGKTVCFTGKSSKPRGEMHRAAAEKGLVPVDSITASTDYLVLADTSSTSSKAVKARKMGVTLLSEEEFWKL